MVTESGQNRISSTPKARAARQRIVAVLTALLLAPSIGWAQGASFGLYIGSPLNDLAAADSSMVATTGRYTFGPALQVNLLHGFNLEADLLYKRLAFGLISNPARLTAHRLELPLLLRYAIHAPLHPFVLAGMSFNRVVAVSGSSACAETATDKFYCIGGQTVVQLRHQHTHGYVLGAGTGFERGALRLEPQLRITRWVDRNFGTRDTSLRSNLTQIELLLGLKF